MVLSNLPSAFDAVSVRLSGCAPFTGEITVGAVTFKVEPSAPALPAALSDTLGEVGASEDFEQANAKGEYSRRRTKDNPFLVHRVEPRLLFWGPLGRA